MHSSQLIYLSRRDTADTACALLQRAKPGAQVWLVAPWRAAMLRDPINLRRLRRVASSAAIDLRLVTRHWETRALAREIGLTVHWSAPLSLRRKNPRPAETADLERRVVTAGEVRRRRYSKPRGLTLRTAFLSLVLTAILGAALAAVVVFFLPTARVELEPVSASQEIAFTLQANPRYREIAFDERVIPARMIQVIVEGQGQTPATGRTDVPDQHASGVVVLANRTAQQVTVPSGTIVRTSGGVTHRFYTTAEAVLPPDMQAHVRVPVISLEPGFLVAERFTVNRVEGELAAQVQALNDVRIEGGGFRQVATVALADFDTLHASLSGSLQQEAQTLFSAELGSGEFVPVATVNVQVMSLVYDQVVDQQSEILSGRMRLVASGMAIQENDIRDMALWLLAQQAGEQSQVIEDSLNVEHSGQIRLLEVGLELDGRARGLVAPVIDQEQVWRAIRGRDLDAASAWLEQNLALRNTPQITLAPDLVHRLPLLAGRMEIVISSSP